MSYVDKSKLRGILDQSLSFFVTTRQFTTSPLILDTLTEYGSYIRAYRIVNLDLINNILYRTVSATDYQKAVPPSTALGDQGWESFLEIIPNAVTGNGYVELELIKRKDAEKPQDQDKR